MADKRRLYDLWILETNTVYRQVPFLVVTDWAQQGRLLAEDRLRPSGTEEWSTLGQTPDFAVYLPKVEPFRVEDQAEALEPVQVDFAWKPRAGDEDDDVDMIPLIDISLVLLIFFMMTAAVSSAASSILTPQAEFKLLTINPTMIWVGIDRGPDGAPVYSLSKNEQKEPEAKDECASREDLLQRLREKLDKADGPVDLRVRASKALPCEIVTQDITVDVEQFKRRGKLRNVYTEVSEKKNP
jgi:biopolymer transport protein ExbD